MQTSELQPRTCGAENEGFIEDIDRIEGAERREEHSRAERQLQGKGREGGRWRSRRIAPFSRLDIWSCPRLGRDVSKGDDRLLETEPGDEPPDETMLLAKTAKGGHGLLAEEPKIADLRLDSLINRAFHETVKQSGGAALEYALAVATRNAEPRRRRTLVHRARPSRARARADLEGRHP